jgi:hypothetical protein
MTTPSFGYNLIQHNIAWTAVGGRRASPVGSGNSVTWQKQQQLFFLQFFNLCERFCIFAKIVLLENKCNL